MHSAQAYKENGVNSIEKKELLAEMRKNYQQAKEAQNTYLKGRGINLKRIIALARQKTKAEYALEAVTEKMRREGEDV